MKLTTKIKYFFSKFNFLRVYFSPFKLIKWKWYFGKISLGTPYFFPRRWKNDKNNPGYQKAVSKKIGFDFVGLGWKTKYDEFRFEWAPIWSFVFFKWQIAIRFLAPYDDHYWECWLYYFYETNKNKTKQERIKEAKIKYSCIWTTYQNNKKEKICYWDLILKEKYL